MEPAKKPTESRGRLPLLLGLAVVLAGLYAWDRWADWSGETAPRPGAGSPGARGPDTADALTAGPGVEPAPGSEPQEAHALASLALDALHDTVRRPLFEKTRRPVEPPPPTRPAVTQPVIPVAPRGADPNALTLLGVLMSEGGGAIALLRRNQTGQNVRLQEGNTVDGWTVERIEAARVLLKQGDTRIALELFRKR